MSAPGSGRPATGRRADRMRLGVVGLGLTLAVFAAFWPVTGNGFIAYDDDRFIYRNPMVLRGPSLATLRWALTSFDEVNWHPVTWIAFLLDWRLFGPNAAGHHLMSVLWHAAAAVLLLLALCRMTGRLWAPALAAALFALHPLRVESVAWATEIKDPLAGCFFGGTLLAYAAYVRRPTLARSAGVAVALALGLMTKASLVPLPLLLIVLDFWPLGRRGARVFLEKIPLLLLAGGASALTYLAQARGGTAGVSFAALALHDRIANALVSAAAYLGKLLWPARLAVFYPHPGATIPAWKTAAAAALLAALGALALAQRRRRPHLLVGLLWFLGMLVPVSGIVQASIQGMADRFTYLPLVGLGVAIAWSAPEAAAALRLPRAARPVAAGAVLIACAAATWVGAGRWRSEKTLFEHALAVTERNPVALLYVGKVRAAEGRPDEAIALFREALAILPSSSIAWFDLGNAYRAKGMLREAIASYRSAIRVARFGAVAALYNNLGGALAQAGELDEAEVQLRRALSLQPGYPDAENNLRFVREARARR